MLGMEDVLCELSREEMMSDQQGLPPGFRFHPTDEELITFYLASKVFNGNFCGVDIAEVDLNRCEPWELPEVAKMGEREWYFFSLRDRKYPTGLRTNRATGAGYWKATGKDREVYSASNGALLGMKKTLVFYKGRAPRGEKTMWVMHEYRLDGDFSCRLTCKEEWVICRILHKAGEKKNPLFLQGQSYVIKSSAASTTIANSLHLPPLLESQDIMQQNPLFQTQNRDTFLANHQESDLKSLINPVVSHANLFDMSLFQPSFSPITEESKALDTSNMKELANMIAKQSTNGNSFIDPHCQISSNVNMNWAGKINQGYQNTQFSWMDGNVMGIAPVSNAALSAIHDNHKMSNSATDVAFNREEFQTMVVDHHPAPPPPIKFPASDSWHVNL